MKPVPILKSILKSPSPSELDAPRSDTPTPERLSLGKTVTIAAPAAIIMANDGETIALVAKPKESKCTWSFFKSACCEALKETCDETCNRPTEEQFINQHINFLPHIP